MTTALSTQFNKIRCDAHGEVEAFQMGNGDVMCAECRNEIVVKFINDSFSRWEAAQRLNVCMSSMRKCPECKAVYVIERGHPAGGCELGAVENVQES